MNQIKINAPADYSVNHFRFQRTATEFPVIESYEQVSKLRWAVAVAVSVPAVLALFIL